MKCCLGITRNLNRCNRIGDWKFFCAEHRLQPVVWVTFIIFTVIAGGASIYSALRPSSTPIKRESKPVIPEPIIKCYLEHPLITKESPPRINKRNPDAIIYNDGAVSVVSLKVDSWVMGFDSSKGQIVTAAKYGRSPHYHLFSVDEFKPSEELKQSIPGISNLDIGIYIFDLAYNRKEDLEKYERRDVLFVEKGIIYRESEFDRHKDYKTLTEAIRQFMNELNTLPKTEFKGTDQHAWVIDPNPRHDVKLNKDGSASLRLRFFNLEQLKTHYSSINRPYLSMAPVKFKDSNTYLKATFHQNTGIVNFVFEVTNEGNEIATDVRQDAETISILSGQKKFLKQEVLLKREPSNSTKLPDEVSESLNFEDHPLFVKTTIYYSSKESIQKQYRTTVTYELKKTGVRLIDSEFE